MERNTGEDRHGDGAYYPRLTVVTGCVIDIGAPVAGFDGLAQTSRLSA
ncbi:MAG: hypothetical protein Q7U52_17205 [Hydrogenophaga sp.]|nr:hypothetical protein [Hydrogenophaga sp.]MDO9149364.1 hypothetical protein [Hydrogenophaga sp.]MDO9603038.1 hypothetical protein [Hydrogenophaga sp.]MDP2165078.1 hypothetical protein [Hydrogenophaga sp.]MDP3476818.1 hypothetical protein [Hydrogenophaga sp.]